MTSIRKFANQIILCVLAMYGIANAAAPEIVPVPGKPFLMLGTFDVAALGYTVEEVFLKGTATAYKSKTGSDDAQPSETAPYATRMVIVRPIDPAKFNGTVVVEWLNVTGGVDAAADWTTLHREIMRSGFAYVAASVQKVGVEGGPNPMGGSYALKKVDPTRYAQLSHPGDAFSFDMYSQAGSVLRSPNASKALGALVAKRVIAVGESQSAMFLTTYVNRIDAVAKAYDGFLIHSRFGVAAPLDGSSIRSTPIDSQQAVKLRSDLRVPVMTVVTETDVIGAGLLGFYGARQPDTEKLRVWEIAGAAHADTYLMGAGTIDSGSAPIEQLAAALAPTRERPGMKLDKLINSGPQQHYVMQAALSHLDRWLSSTQPPPRGSALKVIDGEPLTFVMNADGIAEGGIRTPWVDVPTMRLSGVGSGSSLIAQLVGFSEPFDQARLHRLYPGGQSEYLRKFERSLSAAIEAGFVLAADRQEILNLARASYPAN
jgi:Alpha/beta hydrolase domain